MQVKSIAECSKWEHSAILLTRIKLTFVINVFCLFLSGRLVNGNPILAVSSCMHMRICVHVGMPLVVTYQQEDIKAAYSVTMNIFRKKIFSF